MHKIRSIIVEDSRLARQELKELISKHEDIAVIAEAENVDQAYELIRSLKPELLFLDINMPDKDGFELLEMLDSIPITIFTTAYDQYAIKSFEYNAFDYLLKPISEERFAKAIQKVLSHIEKPAPGRDITSDSQIFLREKERCWMVKLKDISLFEVDGNYTKVFFEQYHPMIYKSLNQIEEKLSEGSFFRINRQQIVNLDHIDKVIPWFSGKLKIHLKNGMEVAMSRRQSILFKEKMGF